ncbi:MBL fold metallo-hydrolase [Ramlibacter sp. WS9]|nr:MBL fold metallo-hydrolase [Ramlibacter sp. WS9]
MMWRVGDISITRLVEMELTIPGGPGSPLPDATPENVRPIGWLFPAFATAEGWIKGSIHALLIQTPTQRFIVDTCVGNDKPRNSPGFNQLATNFLADLESLGWSLDSVDGVLCTHLHVDHVGWNTVLRDGRWVPTFPKARYYLGRVEYEHWASELRGMDVTGEKDEYALAMMDTMNTFTDSVKPIMDADLVELVEVDSQIAPGIRLMSTPGHTPGHVSVVIESKGSRAVITGDMMHHPCQIARMDWCSAFDTDNQQSTDTRQSFCEMFADTPTLIIGTHWGGPTAGRLIREGSAYRLDV